MLPDITPFLFPCRGCKLLTLHVAAEQHAGLGIGLPFAGKPLLSTGRAYHAVCNECTAINTYLTESMIRKLRAEVLPAQFCNLYARVCDPASPAPYSGAFIDEWLSRIPESRPDLRRRAGAVLRCYALETDGAALRQRFCWHCGSRSVPVAKAKSLMARLFADERRPDFFCASCGAGIRPPAVR